MNIFHKDLLESRGLLFLQGPFGPFFKLLGVALEARGHRVHRINLNGGDRYDWGGGDDFVGTPDQWPLFLDAYLLKHGITDIILFGDCRPLHHSALGIARLRQRRIHVFEEGYIRPDFMTLELGGVNGNSNLSSDPDWYVETARSLPTIPVFASVPASFDRRVREGMRYYWAMALGQVRFRHYRTHRPYSPIREGVGWFRRLMWRETEGQRSRKALEAIKGQRYFCFPLQLSSDAQIRTHSPFPSVSAAIDYVIASFARSAPADTLLVLKKHPLDLGFDAFWRTIAGAAARGGVADRVFYVEHGDIVPMVENALGVVTVNSTTGTLALRAGIPTAVLGQAVYNIPRVTHQGPLDSFWGAPRPPETEVYEAFCRVLYDRSLVHGGFLSDEGLDLLVANAVDRIEMAPLRERMDSMSVSKTS